MARASVNGIDLRYEILGSGDPVLCLGGWGTFCEPNHHHLPRGLADHYRLLIHDYRGIGRSTDRPDVPAAMSLYAEDTIGLLDHLQLKKVHLVGLVGMGACVCQEIAIRRPDLARSMLNMGAWAYVDDLLHDQLAMFRDVHEKLGFFAFQKLVCMLSFTPEYYNQNKGRLLGADGAWKELNGCYNTHARLIAACLGFRSLERLPSIRCPSLIIHAGADCVTSPRTTLPIEQAIPDAKGITWNDVAHVVAGKEQKTRFSAALLEWLSSN